ncbi:MAG: ABC transporter substrate-binding protein [Treponemataceae bacterium]|nr:MAG: ABC transporter substrate-binding protein [Treponemataceae bacterium]
MKICMNKKAKTGGLGAARQKNVIRFFALCSIATLFGALFGVTLAACAKKTAGDADAANIVHFSALNGPTAIPAVFLIDKTFLIENKVGDFTVEISASPDLLIPRLLNGEINMGILPVNTAAKMFNTDKNSIVLAATVGEGMLYVMTSDKTVKTLDDLRGKHIYAAGKGATPEYIMRSIAPHIELDFSLPQNEIAPSLLAGKIDYALLPEPFCTTIEIKNPAFFRALDIQAFTQRYPMSALVVNAAFAKAHPESVRNFLALYQSVIAQTNDDPKKTGELAERYAIGFSAEVTEKAIPYAAFRYTDGKEMQTLCETLFGIFLQQSPESIANTMPENAFYF